MSASAPITLTSTDLRDRVEDRLGAWIPDRLWNRAEAYARHKLDIYRERHPDATYYDDVYLVRLTADTVREFDFEDHVNAISRERIAAARA